MLLKKIISFLLVFQFTSTFLGKDFTKSQDDGSDEDEDSEVLAA